MTRLYREVRVAPAGDDWCVQLDSRQLETPARNPLLLPRQGLAAAIAAEWDQQADKVVPSTMPLMRLAATAIDRVAPSRPQVIAEIAGYAQTDLVCYRAERPDDLVRRQAAIWQPLVDWATLRVDAPLRVVTGVTPKPQPAAVAAAFTAVVSRLDDFWLAGLHSATAACGSVIIGLALAERRLAAEAAWQASQLDETYQIEKWGRDAEAERRRDDLRRDIAATASFMDLLRA